MLFSCIMPVKGARPYMKEALGSLAAQYMGNELEVIVQDGDSERDEGQSDALNRGFAKARGEWLFWLNADDVLLAGALQKVTKAIEIFPPDVEWISGNEIFMDGSSRVVKCLRGNRWHNWLYKHAVPHVYGPSSFFKKGLLNRVGGLDETLKFCMDWDLWIRFMKAGAKFHRISAYLWGQRQWDGSKTQRKLSEEQHRAMWTEIELMLNKNGLRTTFCGSTVMRLCRLFSGNIPLQTFDTIRYRGKTIEQIFG